MLSAGPSPLPAQAPATGSDTLHFMQYNLMYYTEDPGIDECNAHTNGLAGKDSALRTIFRYAKPDVLSVCEIGTDTKYAERILNNDLNTDGIGYYRHGQLTNYSGGHIANMLFYDSRKLTLAEDYFITTSCRDINGYKLYWNTSARGGGDTVFITFWVAHLKAGSGSANEAVRLAQTRRLMSRLMSLGGPGNCVFSGDFNITDASQEAYQELVNNSNSLYKFYDPVDRPGHWNNNPEFADLHTQSTHAYPADCFVYGGLDDRFDIVLVSPYVYYGSGRVRVLPSTYHALGQDGCRFNSSVVVPANGSVPAEVADALYRSSDHLPVLVDFAVDAPSAVAGRPAPGFSLHAANPVGAQLEMTLQTTAPALYTFTVYAADGRALDIFKRRLATGTHRVSRNFGFRPGIYFLKATDEKHRFAVKKLVKQ